MPVRMAIYTNGNDTLIIVAETTSSGKYQSKNNCCFQKGSNLWPPALQAHGLQSLQLPICIL
jgi:hypothetical protein